MNLSGVDYLILILYFAFTMGIGWLVKKTVSSSEDFLTSGRSVPVWITSLAFIATNLGAQEVIGMCASGAKYGIMTSHFYWIGAIPAMVFVGIFMMPFYWSSKARSVPEYLKLRFDEKTRGLNAITFAMMTVFSSGISMYALGLLFQMVLGWTFEQSVLLSAAIVLVYTYLGGLTSAIYNEVLQFFLIVVGFAPLAILAVNKAGGWEGMKSNLDPAMVHSWKYMGSAAENPMGLEIIGLSMGLAFVMSFGYWCTNFLVVQRAMAANSYEAARNTPLIAAFPKMVMPFVVIVPGMAAVALASSMAGYQMPVGADGTTNYDLVLTTMMSEFYPSGMLGIGITALLASFMSGMAGNVTAFNTVFTYDIYQSYIRKDAPDAHYLWVGRMTTIVGTILSIGAAYVARQYNNINDILQLVFSFVNAPLLATFLLGMFWKRTTANGAFWGLLLGTFSAAATHGLTVAENKGGWLGGSFWEFSSSMAQNFWIAIVAWTVCFVMTIAISLFTERKTDAELKDLVMGFTEHPPELDLPWYRRPVVLGAIVLVCCLIFNIYFW